MSNIKNIDNMYNTVVIGNNHIKFHNEILRISNISRTWIFTFQNIEKMKFEKAMQAYKDNKAIFEATEIRKKKESIRNNLILLAVSVVLLVLFIKVEYDPGVYVFLCLSGIFAILAYSAALKNVDDDYPYPPPLEDSFPDKYGLGIEMNSGHVVTFAAIGDDGIQALIKLQSNIEEADTHKNTINFNLNENNITIENNDGLINTGDYTNNTINRKDQSNL